MKLAKLNLRTNLGKMLLLVLAVGTGYLMFVHEDSLHTSARTVPASACHGASAHWQHRTIFESGLFKRKKILGLTLVDRPNPIFLSYHLFFPPSGSDFLRTLLPILMMSTTGKTPALDLASIFNAALIEYTKKTGINPITCPFAERLLDCDSPESVIQLLQDTAQNFHDFRGRHSSLSKWLPPVVQVVYLVSGSLGHTACLVSLIDIRCLQCSERFSITSSSARDASCKGCLRGYLCPPHGTHFSSPLVQNFVTFKYNRPQAVSVRATMRLKIFLNVSKAFSNASTFTRRSP